MLAGDGDMFQRAWVMLQQGDPGSILGFLLSSDGGSNADAANPAMDAFLVSGQTSFARLSVK